MADCNSAECQGCVEGCTDGPGGNCNTTCTNITERNELCTCKGCGPDPHGA
jgi:hypothetical protein